MQAECSAFANLVIPILRHVHEARDFAISDFWRKKLSDCRIGKLSVILQAIELSDLRGGVKTNARHIGIKARPQDSGGIGMRVSRSPFESVKSDCRSRCNIEGIDTEMHRDCDNGIGSVHGSGTEAIPLRTENQGEFLGTIVRKLIER